MTEIEALAMDYRVAFLRYLPRRDELALAGGYEIGRKAVASGISLLELTNIHHEVVLDVLRGESPDDLVDVATAASEFFLEVLATHDMTHRGLLSQAAPRPPEVDASGSIT